MSCHFSNSWMDADAIPPRRSSLRYQETAPYSPICSMIDLPSFVRAGWSTRYWSWKQKGLSHFAVILANSLKNIACCSSSMFANSKASSSGDGVISTVIFRCIISILLECDNQFFRPDREEAPAGQNWPLTSDQLFSRSWLPAFAVFATRCPDREFTRKRMHGLL